MTQFVTMDGNVLLDVFSPVIRSQAVAVRCCLAVEVGAGVTVKFVDGDPSQVHLLCDVKHSSLDMMALCLSLADLTVISAELNLDNLVPVCAAFTKACVRNARKSRSPLVCCSAAWAQQLQKILAVTVCTSEEDGWEKVQPRFSTGLEMLQTASLIVQDYKQHAHGTLVMDAMHADVGGFSQITGHLTRSNSVEQMLHIAHQYIQLVTPFSESDQPLLSKQSDDLTLLMAIWNELAAHVYGRLQSELNARSLLTETLQDAVDKQPQSMQQCAKTQSGLIQQMVKLFGMRQRVQQLDTALLKKYFSLAYMFCTSLEKFQQFVKEHALTHLTDGNK
eukprot:TRINITY_DN10394_c0_g1_i1.p1 TRINITY_DN10394_c0_g1~~TRINITY_DN10394_c0_g1_i1.p1  ORF type:complete len:334 (-),score=61.39 TRINITY_DN10394_c0_g1_i1:13-1014(-)